MYYILENLEEFYLQDCLWVFLDLMFNLIAWLYELIYEINEKFALEFYHYFSGNKWLF